MSGSTSSGPGPNCEIDVSALLMLFENDLARIRAEQPD